MLPQRRPWRRVLSYLWDALKGPRHFEDTSALYPTEVTRLEAHYIQNVSLTVICQKKHYEVRYERLPWRRRYVSYHVYSVVGGPAPERFLRASDFALNVPAIYPEHLHSEHAEKAAVEFYIAQLKARL